MGLAPLSINHKMIAPLLGRLPLGRLVSNRLGLSQPLIWAIAIALAQPVLIHLQLPSPQFQLGLLMLNGLDEPRVTCKIIFAITASLKTPRLMLPHS